MRSAGVGVGAGVSVLADKPMQNMNPKIKAGIKIIAGAILPELMPKAPFVGSMGDGLLAGGVIDLTKDLAGDVTSAAATSGIREDQFSEDQYVVDQDFHEVSGQYGVLAGTGEVLPGQNGPDNN